ncbi:MAG: 16S rRNA (cytosine(967)-C(5))-methyltransferase [Cycloclasticus sp. symbiont of Poecilosclerida sp. M]|nr:MAG: 16S rRNA (cytosine(967)-C(5))-methyltransferase [Cycloclasticus sp. symbiont of Poecilosclerida sp. M]
MGKQKYNSRLTAVKIICSVLKHGKSLTQALILTEELDPQNQAFCKELCYGTLRWYHRLDALLSLLLKKPFKEKDLDIKVVCLMGLYQLIYLSTPDHAAVSESVKTCIQTKKTWAKGLTNAVLRNFLRQRKHLEESVDEAPETLHAHPKWLTKQIQHDWPQHYQAILAANNERPPMSLRVNALHSKKDDYQNKLSEQDIASSTNPHAPEALTLEQAVGVDQLPSFWQGDVSVQDAAAQLAANLLDVQPDDNVLDMCAAPGGKTAHILEIAPNNATLIAVDIDEQRTQRITENLERLKLQTTVITADGLQPKEWFGGRLFQRILLDAPCSATGVIRRHPDIKVLKKESDIQQLVALQKKLLNTLWPMLDRKGVILYATCSILAAENSEQVAAFIAENEDAKEIKIESAWGHDCGAGKQIFPGEDHMDGFFYACIRKT